MLRYSLSIRNGYCGNPSVVPLDTYEFWCFSEVGSKAWEGISEEIPNYDTHDRNVI